MGKYWDNDHNSQSALYDYSAVPDYDDDNNDDPSDMSEWASEIEEQPLQRPVFKSKTEEKEWERKQRNREYRIAARREKRNRKADEKKQRKLNATILRRMTKNPDKYNKNIDRNRRREVEQERRRIYKEATSQAERLAAIHDPSGKRFNVGPVVTQEDGKVITVEALQRRTQSQLERAAKLAAEAAGGSGTPADIIEIKPAVVNGVNPARQQQIQMSGEAPVKQMSKNQQKKLALFEERPPPPKPIIPEGIEIPEGEENWLVLWDISDDELERRVIREKKRKAADRKALREKQKEGKAERRAARDERRKVYREKKLEWKAIKEEEKTQKRKLLRVEQEEAKRIAIEVNLAERARAMQICAELGFTLENVEGVEDIKPKALGMRGQDVDFDMLEIGDRPSELRIKDEKYAAQLKSKSQSNRVDLGKAPDESRTKLIATGGEAVTRGLDDDFVSFDFDDGKVEGGEFEEVKYNHKLRRKLHRAIEAAQIKKELLVRATAKDHCEANGIEIPPELAVAYVPIKLTGRRTLEDGTVETEKQERVRKRLELAEYNKAAKVLRAQAKAEAIEAGLRVFAELTGKVVKEEGESEVEKNSGSQVNGVVSEQDISITEVSKKRRRSADGTNIKPKKKAKKSKKGASSDVAVAVAEDATENPGRISEVVKIIDEDSESDDARNQKKRLKKERKSREAQEASNGTVLEGKQAQGEVKTTGEPEIPTQKNQKGKKEVTTMEERREVNGAEQWNADALSGDTARKDKFLRLLGAGKFNGADITEKSLKRSKSPKKSFAAISAVENELERQFEAGVRMKHDGQGKRRGLGA